MPIKMLNLNLSIPIAEFLVFAAQRSTGLRIDVLGDDKPVSKKDVKLLEGPKPKALPRPKGVHARTRGKDANGAPMTAIAVMLKTMAHKPKHTMKLAELRLLMTSVGLTEGSANSQMFIMMKRGLARKIVDGEYQLTAQGLRECVRLGFKIGQAETKTKKPAKAPVKAKKPAAPKTQEPAEVPAVTEETQNG